MGWWKMDEWVIWEGTPPRTKLSPFFCSLLYLLLKGACEGGGSYFLLLSNAPTEGQVLVSFVSLGQIPS